MSTTEQRTGFRLPWSTDDRPPGSASKAEPSGRSGSDEPDATVASAVDASTTGATDDVEPGFETAPSEADLAAANAELHAAADMAWPDVDRRVRQVGRRTTDRDPNPATVEAIVTRLQVGQSHRINPLMAELSKAMHAAAQAARADTLERLAADAEARIEAIRAASADEAAQLKQNADADIGAVREWSKAELSRIREETERRISARRADLEHQVTAHSSHLERRIERVHRTVDAFEREMAAFFEMLLDEQNPTRVALLAEQLPEPPSFDLDDVPDDADDVEASVTDPADEVLIGDSASTEAGADETPEAALSPEGAAVAEAEAVVLATVDPDAASDANDAGTETSRTELVVTGLVSVASIAGFKRDVSRISGVTAVGVRSGPDDEFVFIVDHAPDIDLKAAVAELRGVVATSTADTDGIIHLSARDRGPDA